MLPEMMTEKQLEQETQLLTRLSAQQIQLILQEVCTDMLSGLEVAYQLDH